MNRHGLRLTLDKYGASWEVVCPFSAFDKTRPCWPAAEPGEVQPASTECVLVGWVENGDEVITAEGSIDLSVTRVEWHGECPEIFTNIGESS